MVNRSHSGDLRGRSAAVQRTVFSDAFRSEQVEAPDLADIHSPGWKLKEGDG